MSHRGGIEMQTQKKKKRLLQVESFCHIRLALHKTFQKNHLRELQTKEKAEFSTYGALGPFSNIQMKIVKKNVFPTPIKFKIIDFLEIKNVALPKEVSRKKKTFFFKQMPFTLPSLQRPNSASPSRPTVPRTHAVSPSHESAAGDPTATSQQLKQIRHGSPPTTTDNSASKQAALTRLQQEEHAQAQQAARETLAVGSRRSCELSAGVSGEGTIATFVSSDWFRLRRASILTSAEAARSACQHEQLGVWGLLTRMYTVTMDEIRTRAELTDTMSAELASLVYFARQSLRTTAHLEQAPSSLCAAAGELQRTPSFESLSAEPHFPQSKKTVRSPLPAPAGATPLDLRPQSPAKTHHNNNTATHDATDTTSSQTIAVAEWW